MNDTIDTTHWSFDAFEAAGYPRETLFDPGQVTPADFDGRDWRVLELKVHGIEMFDVDETHLTHADWAPVDGLVVEYGSINTQRPVGFADDTGLLNAPERMPSREVFNADSDPTIAFLWPHDAERSFPKYTAPEAVEALGFWGSEGWVPRGTVEAIFAGIGASGASVAFQDDPDVEGEEIIRAPQVAKAAGAAVLGSAERSDSDISGHRKRRRQEFHRNLSALWEHYGLGDE